MPRRLMNYVHCSLHTSSQKQYYIWHIAYGILHPGSANNWLGSRIKESSEKLWLLENKTGVATNGPANPQRISGNSPSLLHALSASVERRLKMWQQASPSFYISRKYAGLHNKVDELCARTTFISDYRNASVLCLTETWLKPDTPNTHVEPVYRGDRTVGDFQQTPVGNICRQDITLHAIGMHLWLKDRAMVDQHDEVRKSVMPDMRSLAALFLHYKQQEKGSTTEVKDMFKRENWARLVEAVRSMTTREEGISSKEWRIPCTIFFWRLQILYNARR